MSENQRAAPYTERLPVLGVPTTFESNEREVVELAAREYGAWRALMQTPSLLSGSRTVVRVLVEDRSMRSSGGRSEGGFAYTVREPHRMEVHGELGHGVADALRRQSLAHVEAELLEQPEMLVRGLLEPLTLFLLGPLDRVPLHAAGILRDGVGVVIAGRSGAGKSTLAYAASRAGFSVLADDPVYVQVEPGLRVWGRHARVHLRPDAASLFPELGGLPPTELPGGKRKLVVETAAGPRHAERVGLCVLDREPGQPAGLTPISAAEAVSELTARLDPGFDLFRDQIGDRVARVAERGAWVLRPGSDPRAGVALLQEAAAAIASRP